MAVLFVLVILIFKAINNRSLIDAIYMIASYTYGPLLGLFSFGLFTRLKTNDKAVPFICIASPLACYLINQLIYRSTGYLFGYELLLLNGLITFAGLWANRNKQGKQGKQRKPGKPGKQGKPGNWVTGYWVRGEG
jgi:Na+/proline symporter